jgi:hypothetical protein
MLLDFTEYSDSSEKCEILKRYVDHIPTAAEQFTVQNYGYIKYEQIEVPLQILPTRKIAIKHRDPISKIRVQLYQSVPIGTQMFLSINNNNVMCSRSTSTQVEFDFNSPKISDMLKTYISQIAGKNYLCSESINVELYSPLIYELGKVNIEYEVLKHEKAYTIIESEPNHIGQKYSISTYMPTSLFEIIATKNSEISIEFPGESNIEWECIRLHPVKADIYAINRYIHTYEHNPENLYKFVLMFKYKSYISEKSPSTNIVPDRCKSKMINFSKLDKTILTVSNGKLLNLYQNRWMGYHINGMPKFTY